MMSKNKQIQRWSKDFRTLQRELTHIDVFKKGSISKRMMTCGNLNCLCHSDKQARHGPYYYWTSKIKGKSTAILIPADMLTEVRGYLENYQQFSRIIDGLTALSSRIIVKRIEDAKKQSKQNKKK